LPRKDDRAQEVGADDALRRVEVAEVGVGAAGDALAQPRFALACRLGDRGGDFRHRLSVPSGVRGSTYSSFPSSTVMSSILFEVLYGLKHAVRTNRGTPIS
jgi:hypothetical protein